jgi:pimeloyl-ACP methyl ester carboxylesterase
MTGIAAGSAADPSAAWTRIEWGPYVHDARIRGRRLRYLDYGSGPVLLFVHGTGGSWQSWLENIPELSRENRILAPDLPGFGGSDPPAPGSEVDEYSETLVALLDHVGVEPAVVAGHSLGGLIASDLALRHPERVRGLILVNGTGIEIGHARLAVIVRTFIVFGALFRRPGVMRAISRRPRLRRAFLYGFVRDPAGMGAELASETIPLMVAPGLETAVRAGAQASGRLPPERIEVPTLLVWGRHDRILRLSLAEELAEAIPDARLEVIDEAGHAPMFECPAEFNAAVGGFVRELASAG